VGPGSTSRVFSNRDRFSAEQLLQSHRRSEGQEAVFNVAWRRPLVEPEFLEWTPREFLRPAVDDSGRVYVATRDGYVRAFDQDGIQLWETKVKGPFYGGITVDGDKVFVPSADGLLLALSTADGTQKWAYRAGEELGTKPVVANGLVFVSSFADSIFAVDAETGAWKWQYRRDVAAEFTIRGVGTPAVDFDKVFVGFSDGTAMCLDANDGSVKWTKQLSSARQFPDVDASPQLDGAGHVVFASYAAGLFSLDEETGNQVWVNAVPGVTELLLEGDAVFAGSAQALFAVNLSNGATRWKVSIPDGYAGEPTLLSRYLIVPTTRALVFLDRQTGEPRKVFDPGRGISAAPGVSRNQLYVVSNYGFLYALSVARPPPG
jgi:outer membrane protein assembly factor BamB